MSEMRIDGPQGTLIADVGGTGDRRPVLFLHSDGGNASHWAEALAHLRPTRQAIALNLRGHGPSATPRNGDYSTIGRADDVAAVVDALGLARLVIVGHSGGGAVGLQYTGTHPERVAGLLLVDPATDGRQIPEAMRDGLLAQLRSPAYEQTIRDYFASQAGTNPAVVERVLTDVAATRSETMIGTTEAIVAFDPLPALRAYHGPRLSLVTPPNDHPAAYHRLEPSLPHRIVEGTGHWLYLDDPPAFNRILDAFLATVSDDAS